MAFTDVHNWLTAESPASRMQARLIRFYRMTGALSRNVLATVGFFIILGIMVWAIGNDLWRVLGRFIGG